jgi:hypothetical protein
MPRIRWVIEENKLLAFRDYELIEGANPGMPQPGSFLGQPVAAVPGSTFRTFNPTVVRPVCTGPTDWARATSSWTRMFRTAATRQKMPIRWSSSRTACSDRSRAGRKTPRVAARRIVPGVPDRAANRVRH